MRRIKPNKIVFDGYMGGDIACTPNFWKDRYKLESSIKLVPYDLDFSEEEMREFVELLTYQNKLKITIEKVEE